MPYEISNGCVVYNRRTITGALPESLTIADERVAWDAANVYFFGKPYPASDTKTFEYLDPVFSKDARVVYCIRGNKVIALNKLDSGSFRVLGHGYGCDHKKVTRYGKLVLGARPESLRVFDERIAIDDRAVYFTTQKIATTKGLFAASDVKRVLVDVNAFEGVETLAIMTSDSVWVQEQRNGALHRLENAHPSSFELLGDGNARDANSFYAGFRPLPGFDVNRLRCLRPGRVWTDDRVIVMDNAIVAGADPASFCHVTDDYYLDDRAVYKAGARVAECDCTPLHDDVLQSRLNDCIAQLAGHFFSLFDNWLPYGGRDERVISADVALPVPPIHAQLRDGRLVLVSEDLRLEGELMSVDALLSHIWSRQRYGVAFRRYVHESGTYLPKGSVLIRETIAVGGKALCAIANTLFASGHRQDASGLVEWIDHIHSRKLDIVGWLSALSPAVLAAHPPPSTPTERTTYLSRAKEIVKQRVLFSTEYVIRQRAWAELYGLIGDTDKGSEFLKQIFPHLHEALQREPSTCLRDACLAAMDFGIARFFIGRSADYFDIRRQALPYVQILVDHRFNLDANLIRLRECALAVNCSALADVALTQLRNLVGEDMPLPGRWGGLHIKSYPTLEFALIHSDLIRATHGPRPTGEAFVSDILARLDPWREKLGYREAQHCYNEFLYTLDRIGPSPLFNVDDPEICHTTYHAARRAARAATHTCGAFRLLSQGVYVPRPVRAADDLEAYSLVKPGSRLQLQRGDRIGLEFLPEGFPWGRLLKTDITVLHPSIRGSVATHYADCATGLGIRNGFFWWFETDEECVQGEWAIQIALDGLVVLQVQFDIRFATSE